MASSPFDLCVYCETPPAPFGMSSTTNERSEQCLSNLPAPELNDLRDPKQALHQNWTRRLLSPLCGLCNDSDYDNSGID